jgi:hypothetical protein
VLAELWNMLAEGVECASGTVECASGTVECASGWCGIC